MPPKTKSTASPAFKSEYYRLENRLVLLGWLNSLFGYEHNRDLFKDIEGAGEGWDSSGRSHVINRLLSRGDECLVNETDLCRYDANIRKHLTSMNRGRVEKITLRYFQFLAAIYAEIFLDRLFNHPKLLLADLNRFVADRNKKRIAEEIHDPVFTEADLQKFAFWMATGSGKTLLMHINYRQYLHYNTKPLDNVLLVTPNEGLTQQHLEQFAASGIPAERFDLQSSGLFSSRRNVVRVIEITKLVETKKGGGVSVPVEALQGNNLIFVDEGHKGSGGEAWRGYRDKLGETGFTFEYSATFGQALHAAGNDDLTKEYAKAIVFDYSYKYFYGDGFGKDFNILNLRKTSSHDETDVMLLANLLSFYEQARYFDTHGSKLKPYNLASPLWLFIGQKVTAIYSEHGKKRSDVLSVVQFLNRFLKNERGWTIQAIENVINGESGLKMDSGADLFANDLHTLKDSKMDGRTMFADIVRRLFRAESPASLEMNIIRSADGELGLRVHGASAYFGLIYVGDAPAFRALVEEHAPDVEVGEEAIGGALFTTINGPKSDLQILIGAKKFIEGWDSWRVSNMCLLNVGRSEGSEIIQLFGRGVRLKGLNGGLKRSTSIAGKDHPKDIRLLERLNIFAIRADYMSQFRNYLEREGVDTGGVIELTLKLWGETGFKDENLYVPRWPEESTFLDKETIELQVDEKATIRHDISTRIEAIVGSRGAIKDSSATVGASVRITDSILALLDWEQIRIELVAHRESAGYRNLLIPTGTPRTILSASGPAMYDLIAPKSLLSPSRFDGVGKIEALAVEILKRYMDSYYRLQQRRWDSQHLKYSTLTMRESNFQNYSVRVPISEPKLVTAVKKLIKEKAKRFKASVKELPNLYFDRHIYQPLLLETRDEVTIAPPGLNTGEAQFVKDLRDYCAKEKDGSLKDKKIFLLRNLARGKGIGFFEGAGFYPDFILWVKQGKEQRIIFVEPHGLLHDAVPAKNEKVGLHKKLKEDAAPELKKLKHVSLDAFVISATPYDKLRDKWVHDDGSSWTKDECAEEHVLFPLREGDYDYIPHILDTAYIKGRGKANKGQTS
jgi:hypothetical protein